MKVTVIVDDAAVVVDGVGRECVFAAPEDVRVIQWDGAHGYYEIRPAHGGGLRWFEAGEEEGVLAPFIAAWTAAELAPMPPPEQDGAQPSPLPGALTAYEIQVLSMRNDANNRVIAERDALIAERVTPDERNALALRPADDPDRLYVAAVEARADEMLLAILGMDETQLGAFQPDGWP